MSKQQRQQAKTLQFDCNGYTIFKIGRNGTYQVQLPNAKVTGSRSKCVGAAMRAPTKTLQASPYFETCDGCDGLLVEGAPVAYCGHLGDGKLCPSCYDASPDCPNCGGVCFR